MLNSWQSSSKLIKGSMHRTLRAMNTHWGPSFNLNCIYQWHHTLIKHNNLVKWLLITVMILYWPTISMMEWQLNDRSLFSITYNIKTNAVVQENAYLSWHGRGSKWYESMLQSVQLSFQQYYMLHNELPHMPKVLTVAWFWVQDWPLYTIYIVISGQRIAEVSHQHVLFCKMDHVYPVCCCNNTCFLASK